MIIIENVLENINAEKYNLVSMVSKEKISSHDYFRI